MERRNTEAALIPTLQLLSYLIIALGALFMAFKAGSLPASRWEPMNAGTFPQIIFFSIAILCGSYCRYSLGNSGETKQDHKKKPPDCDVAA